MSPQSTSQEGLVAPGLSHVPLGPPQPCQDATQKVASRRACWVSNQRAATNIWTTNARFTNVMVHLLPPAGLNAQYPVSRVWHARTAARTAARTNKRSVHDGCPTDIDAERALHDNDPLDDSDICRHDTDGTSRVSNWTVQRSPLITSLRTRGCALQRLRLSEQALAAVTCRPLRVTSLSVASDRLQFLDCAVGPVNEGLGRKE